MNYLPDAALFLLFFALLLGFGAALISPQRPVLHLVFPPLGFLGVWATLFYLVGLAGGLQPLPFWLLALAVLATAIVCKRQQGRENFGRLRASFRSLSVLERVLALYVALVAAMLFVLSLAPPGASDYDSLVYHLAAPSQWLRNGRVTELPFDHHSYFPFVGEMLYALGLGARGAVFAKLFHWAMFVLGAFILAGLGRRASNSRTAGLWAGVLFVSLPMAQNEATTAYVDLGFSAFAWAGVALFVEALWFERDASARRRDWLGAGAFCGLCLGSKYLGWLVFGFLGLWLLVVSLRGKAAIGEGKAVAGADDEHNEPQKQSANETSSFGSSAVGHSGERWVRLAWLGLPALLLGGFWYARNIWWTGNPVFPFAFGVFGGRGWTGEMAAKYDESQAIYGFGKTVLDLLLLPWRLAMTPLNVGGKGLPFWPLDTSTLASGNQTGLFEVPGLALAIFPGPLLLALGLPALAARRKGAPLGFLAWMFAFLWAFWAMTSQQVRYLFPALGLLCVLGGWVLATRIARFRLASLVAGVGVFAWMLFAPAFSLWNARPTFAVLSGAETSDQYLRHAFAGYDAMSWIGANTPASSRVAVYGEPRDYYLARPYFWADDGHNNLVNYEAITTPAALASALKALGATRILFNRNAGRNGGVFGPPQPLFDQMVAQGLAQLRYSRRGYEVYVLN